MSKNRLDRLFGAGKKDLLSVYFTAGYPKLNDLPEILEGLNEGGADLVEIGIPFSDPVADGPTIQESNQIALDNGITLAGIFDQLKGIRKKVDMPLIMMGYLNPIIQYGLEKFCQKCSEVGIDGIIVPDLPMLEYINDYKALFNSYNLYNTFLITPQTSESRIRLIDENTSGFIYMVSSASTTGAKSTISDAQMAYFNRVKAMNLKKPTLIGFGISSHETFKTACEYADGAIIGSAFIRLLKSSKQLKADIVQFIQSVKYNNA